MTALPIVESRLGLAVIEEAADLFRRARRVGLTVRSSLDCLIAACAIRHDLEVLHRKRLGGAGQGVVAPRAEPVTRTGVT